MNFFCNNTLSAEQYYNVPFFYLQLNSNQQDVYNALAKHTVPVSVTECITLSNPLIIDKEYGYNQTLSTEDKSKINLFISSITQSSIQALIYDNPSFFWLDTTYTCTCKVNYTDNSIVINTIYIPLNISYLFRNTQQAYNLKIEVENAIEQFPINTNGSKYQTLRSIYQNIIETTTYSSQAKYCHIPIGVFIEPHQAVCDGYSKAFKMVCDYYNIPCVLVCGTASQQYHMWCYVQMEDNLWYAVDPTWDDNNSKYIYFLKGYNFFSKSHLQFSNNTEFGLNFPKLNYENYTSFPEIDLQRDMYIDVFDYLTCKEYIIKKNAIPYNSSDISTFILNLKGKET